MKQRLLLLLLLPMLLGAATVQAQQQDQQKIKFAIASFGQDPFDTTPTNPDYEKVDGNGARYAIIKVTSTNPEDELRAYRFNFGNLNSLVEEHNGQLWVYVQRNAKLVTITREGYQTIDKHDLGMTIEAGKTYIMQLASAGIAISRQTVMFNVTPPNANASIVVKSDKPGAKEEEFGTTNASGMVGKNLELGTYTYRIVANNYQPTEGRITLKDKSNVHIEAVKLQDVLYPMTITSSPSISKVYLNGDYVGRTPFNGEYSAGTYQLELKHINNKTFKSEITINKNDGEYNYKLEKQYLKKYSGYIQGFFGSGLGHTLNCGFSAGAYIYNVNAELGVSFYSPFEEKNKSYSESYFTSCYLMPTWAIYTKWGYGFIVKKCIRITPQMGINCMDFISDPYGYGGRAFSMSLGARGELMIVRHFGLFLSINGQIGLSATNGEPVEKFKTWMSGLDCKFGLFVSF